MIEDNTNKLYFSVKHHSHTYLYYGLIFPCKNITFLSVLHYTSFYNYSSI